MKRIVFSTSIRFSDECLQWAQTLIAAGVDVYVPRREVTDSEWRELSAKEQRLLQRRLIDEHNRHMQQADMIFIFNQGGYVGNSVTLEMGYGLGLGKPVYALQPDAELGRDVMYAGYCKTPEELLAVLQ